MQPSSIYCKMEMKAFRSIKGSRTILRKKLAWKLLWAKFRLFQQQLNVEIEAERTERKQEKQKKVEDRRKLETEGKAKRTEEAEEQKKARRNRRKQRQKES